MPRRGGGYKTLPPKAALSPHQHGRFVYDDRHRIYTTEPGKISYLILFNMKWKHENKYTLTHVMRYIVSRKKYTPGEYIFESLY